uniref:Ribosomal protein S11 n=1 Tax=Sarcopeltis skottsbergii TaxID=2765380 RepID=A0A7M1VHW9_SARSK|nr:ribosomal protein S11 [Sarcopeltis skottsbergii]QOS04468.1 ribosomal protein S11 [Sarcopeltis skottsbergii]
MENNSKLIILSILFTPNNILYYITRLNGNVIFWTSSGTKKQKNTKKVTLISITTAIAHIRHKLKYTDYIGLHINIKGFSKNKKIVVRQLKQSTLNILSISDKISWPHNGCKQKKIRRI